jgi:NADH-quinone oxidoreductase subunit N
VGSAQGASAMLFYLLAYTLATFGAFAVIIVMSRDDAPVSTDDLAGLWTARPWLAVAMTVCMLALMGFPIFGGIGFFAKWYILKAALQAAAPQYALSVVLVLTTIISAGYYLYVIMVMFMRPRAADAPPIPETPGFTRFVMVASVAAILGLGLLPEYTVRLAAVGYPNMNIYDAHGAPAPRAAPPPQTAVVP